MDTCQIHDHHLLNFSDHLPIAVILNLNSVTLNPPSHQARLNWPKAVAEGSIGTYQAEISRGITPLLAHSLANSEIIDKEITAVTNLIHNAAASCIPAYRGKRRRKMFIHDESLAVKCRKSKAAWKRWRNAGRPQSGLLYDSMKSSKRDVKQYVNICRVRDERTRIQQRDTMLKNKEAGFFRVPRKRVECQKLLVDGSPVTNQSDLLHAWCNHFTSLSQTHVDLYPSVLEVESKLPHFEALSQMNEDRILDVDVTLEEVEAAVRALKSGKSGGADRLVPEHLKFGGPALLSWLLRIFTAVIELELIPSCFKLGVISPVYKGKGRDPCNPNSYRGITLTSVLSKCFERILLGRMVLPFTEAGFPHASQTAYQRGISCSDAIFSTQEALLKFVREGSSP